MEILPEDKYFKLKKNFPQDETFLPDVSKIGMFLNRQTKRFSSLDETYPAYI